MRYIDSGHRDAAQTLGRWLEDNFNRDAVELRIQTGFFSINSIGLLADTLERFKSSDLTTRILIGSNDANTLKDDIAHLTNLLGIPRSRAALGIVSYADGYYHPKTYHIRRYDGSQAAYIGSANLTASGLALHVEAGITLDTNEGDPSDVLEQIAQAVDAWFEQQRSGMTIVTDLDTVDQLATTGVLALQRPPRTSSAANPATQATPTLPRLLQLPAPPPQIQRATPAPIIIQNLVIPQTASEFWIQTGALTGGSRNQLDLSMRSAFGRIEGSTRFFFSNPTETANIHKIDIRYNGIDYYENTIKFPVTPDGKGNGTWRLLLNGKSTNGEKLTIHCPNFRKKILTLSRISSTHFEISDIHGLERLNDFKQKSILWDANRGQGARVGRGFGYLS